ncbi:hypothetical protein [Natronospora cellulosivora (SeqCode)]
MQKKWVYNLALVLLVIGLLMFLVPSINSAARGFLAGWRDAAVDVYEPSSASTTPDSVFYISLGIIIIALLIIGFNKILYKLDEIAKTRIED